MGLFDRFKKNTEEEEQGVQTETAAVKEETAETVENTGAKQPVERTAAPQLNQTIARGIFHESLAMYQELPVEQRAEGMREALLNLTNDVLSKTFLEAVSTEGMATPDRVRNNISRADENTCRLALLQLATEGEGKPKELQNILGQTQALLFRRILELNPEAGTSEKATAPIPEAPEGETPADFFRLELNVKTLEKQLRDAQKALSGSEEKTEEQTQALEAARKKYLAEADRLAAEILKLPVIYAAYDSRVRPEMPWIANNGHTELYTSKKLSQQVEEGFRKQGITNMMIKELKGEEIAAYVEMAQHLGIQHLLIDNGRTPIDLRFDRIKALEEENLLEYANRAIRFEFLRAKSYGLMYAALSEEEQQGEEGKNLRDRLLTMLFNAYRELGMGISYTLMKAEHREDTTFFTEKAMEMAEALQQSVFKGRTLVAPGDKRTEVVRDHLSLALVKRGTAEAKTPEEIQKLPSLVPVFSDIASARTLQASLALQHAQYEILAITWDELKSCAANQPGIVYAPEQLGLFIPKEDFEKIDQFRQVRGRILIDHHKQQS